MKRDRERPLRQHLAGILAAALAAILPARSASAVQVTGLAAIHHDGQTFLTWTSPPGGGRTYRVYLSPQAIASSSELPPATLLGQVGDSTWCDRRLSSLSGTIYGYAVDSLAAPLDSTRGLFVWTPADTTSSYYAVTCQSAAGTEDVGITPGSNSLLVPVSESLGRLRPVFQRTLAGPFNCPADVYTLWTSPARTRLFPAMCNRASVAYDCGVHHGLPGGGLMFHAHVRGGSFYPACWGSGMWGEWVLTMDDFVRTPQVNTFWFGYHSSYDIESAADPLPPVSGTVADYTTIRQGFTLEWARRNFPVDTTRVYVMGASMGGIAGVFLAMSRPDLIAATMVNIPLFDFSFNSDPNPLAQFNEGGYQRQTCDKLWGTIATGLHVADGTPVYDRLNAGLLAARLESRFVPPIIAFNGRNDATVGWAEKIPFYGAMREHRAGGMFFWDTRNHMNTATGGAWWSMQNYQYVYRFRTNLSFPALSNCSADGNPGNGNAADGDSIGSINGFVEWDNTILDEPTHWKVRLTLRDLTTLWGTVVRAPDSLTVDVTPRRLQAFLLPPRNTYFWLVRRSSDGQIIQSDSAVTNTMGILTIPGVKVMREGSVLELQAMPLVGVEPGSAAGAGERPGIGPLASPVRGACSLRLEWPRAGEASVDVLDLGGRRVRTLFRGSVRGGVEVVRLDPAGLSSGMYFLIAREGSAAAGRCFAVLH